MKLRIALCLIFLSIFATSLYATGPTGPYYSQYYYEDCEWYSEQAYTYCEQDWMLFAYWPLWCEEICDFQEFCLGLFPASENDEEYELDEAYFCAKFRVVGQLNWLFDAFGWVSYAQSGVTVDFIWRHGPNFASAGANFLANGQGFGPVGPFVLSTPSGGPNGNGEWWFKVCADKLYIDAGFNGYASLTTHLGVIYEI